MVLLLLLSALTARFRGPVGDRQQAAGGASSHHSRQPSPAAVALNPPPPPQPGPRRPSVPSPITQPLEDRMRANQLAGPRGRPVVVSYVVGWLP